MTDLTKGKLITKLGYIAHFNEQVFDKIAETAGGYSISGSTYTAPINSQNAVTLADKRTTVTEDETTGAILSSSEQSVKIEGLKTWAYTSYYGENTSTGTVQYQNPSVLTESHLKSIEDNSRAYFLLMPEDLEGNVIIADVVYRACFNILSAVISIRPYQASWTHESNVSGKSINASLSSFAYGVFVDSPSSVSTSTYGTGTWGAGGNLYYWQVTLGGNITALNLQEDSVSRDGVYTGSVISALKTSTMVSNFWNAWSDRCMAKNSFNYKFFTCHLNCHSSCHSSCHGSRSRR